MIKRRISDCDSYEQDSGGAITFLGKHHGMDFKKSVRYLLDLGGHSRDHPIHAKPHFVAAPKNKPLFAFALPKAHAECRRAFAYYIKQGRSREVIADFIRSGLLYESADYRNAVFAVMNSKSKPVNADIRGTYYQNSNGFRGDAPGGDKNSAFCLPADQDIKPFFNLKALLTS
ncbi:MAG: DUF3991 domain-containing protein [Christensenellales bacterium]